MDNALCHVIYLDKRASDERTVTLNDIRSDGRAPQGEGGAVDTAEELSPEEEVNRNVRTLLSLYPEVHICRTGASCLSKLAAAHQTHNEVYRTIVLAEIPPDERLALSREPRSPSPTTTTQHEFFSRADLEPDLYGLKFIQHISAEIRLQNLSALVIPFAFIRAKSDKLDKALAMARFLDAGAADVFASPFSLERIQCMPSHVYRISRERRRRSSSFHPSRKTSWVGTSDTKPYSYLREMMVSGLMDGICNPDRLDPTIDPDDLLVEPERQDAVAKVVGTWSFSAHDFTDDELLYGALLMLQHTLQLPGLETWHISKDQLTIFLIATRRVYNSFVRYHNFRHACDVLQATFFFLIQIGIIPPYNDTSVAAQRSLSPLASLLKPFHALTLLIAAIGHDVGHPGVNNLFLVKLNAPLAQLYNDRSVLESFHCAAYSQILRRYWTAAFSDSPMRRLMINIILATDMGLHVQYMSQMGNLQEKFAHDEYMTDRWNDKTLEEYRELLCCLLIKCADICNVARKFPVATRWAIILTDEFATQGEMEQELQMATCLFGGPPVRDDMLKLASAQIGFMNIFAGPLFQNVTDILPNMQFSVDEINTNREIWETKMREGKLEGLAPKDSPGIAPHEKKKNRYSGSQILGVQYQEAKSPRRAAETSPPLRESQSEPADESPTGGLPDLSGLPPPATEQGRRSTIVVPSTQTSASDATARRSSGGWSSSDTPSFPRPAPNSSDAVQLPHRTDPDGKNDTARNRAPAIGESDKSVEPGKLNYNSSTTSELAKPTTNDFFREPLSSSVSPPRLRLEKIPLAPSQRYVSLDEQMKSAADRPDSQWRPQSRKTFSFKFWRKKSPSRPP